MKGFVVFAAIVLIFFVFTNALSAITLNDLWFPGDIGSSWTYKGVNFSPVVTKGIDEKGFKLQESQVFFGGIFNDGKPGGPFGSFRFEGNKVIGPGEKANALVVQRISDAIKRLGWDEIETKAKTPEWTLFCWPIDQGKWWVIAEFSTTYISKAFFGGKTTELAEYFGTVEGIAENEVIIGLCYQTKLEHGEWEGKILQRWTIRAGIGITGLEEWEVWQWKLKVGLVKSNIIPIIQPKPQPGRSVNPNDKLSTTWGAVKKVSE